MTAGTPCALRAEEAVVIAGTFGPGFAAPVPVMPTGAESLRAAVTDDHAAEINCLAQAVAYEAANEPEAGRQAVAQVILNRVRHRAFPKTVCGVVYQGSQRRTGCQFTFTCDGSLRRVLSRRTWAEAMRIAGQVLDGTATAQVGAATHYHADYVSPRWAPAMVKVGQIGAHIFYHFPGKSGGDGAIALAARGRSNAAQPVTVFSVWGLATPTGRPTN